MEAASGGGGVLVSNNCFFTTKHISLLELYFYDSVQTVYAHGGGGGSQQREVADGADVRERTNHEIPDPIRASSFPQS